jgi:NCAIR mutase (PurE)-related protein
MTLKRERKKKVKEKKEAKRKALLEKRDQGIPDENGKKVVVNDDGKTPREVKKAKAKRVAKLTRVMPTKAERKARKKEKKIIKMAARKEAAKIKARAGAAKNKAARELAGEAAS